MSGEAAAPEIKEVAMEVAADDQAGGGRTRRRRGTGRRRRTARATDAEAQEGGGAEIGVERVEATPSTVRSTVRADGRTDLADGRGDLPPKPASVSPNLATAKPPVVVIAPAKKKPAKIMLVPKSTGVRAVPKKTFKARKVRVSVDNSAKTVKRRRSVLGRIDTMTDTELRAKAVAIRLSRPETVAKAPVPLLRQMVKDYYTMRGSFL